MLICNLFFVLRKNYSTGERRSEVKAGGSTDLVETSYFAQKTKQPSEVVWL